MRIFEKKKTHPVNISIAFHLSNHVRVSDKDNRKRVLKELDKRVKGGGGGVEKVQGEGRSHAHVHLQLEDTGRKKTCEQIQEEGARRAKLLGAGSLS